MSWAIHTNSKVMWATSANTVFKQSGTLQWFNLCASQTGCVSWMENFISFIWKIKSIRSQKKPSPYIQASEMAFNNWQQAFSLSITSLIQNYSVHWKLITCFCIHNFKANFFAFQGTVCIKTDFELFKKDFVLVNEKGPWRSHANKSVKANKKKSGKTPFKKEIRLMHQYRIFFEVSKFCMDNF